MKKIKTMIWHRIKRYLSRRRKFEFRKAISGLKENQSKIVDITNYLMSNKSSKLVYSSISETPSFWFMYFLCENIFVNRQQHSDLFQLSQRNTSLLKDRHWYIIKLFKQFLLWNFLFNFSLSSLVKPVDLVENRRITDQV